MTRTLGRPAVVSGRSCHLRAAGWQKGYGISHTQGDACDNLPREQTYASNKGKKSGLIYQTERSMTIKQKDHPIIATDS